MNKKRQLTIIYVLGAAITTAVPTMPVCASPTKPVLKAIDPSAAKIEETPIEAPVDPEPPKSDNAPAPARTPQYKYQPYQPTAQPPAGYQPAGQPAYAPPVQPPGQPAYAPAQPGYPPPGQPAYAQAPPSGQPGYAPPQPAGQRQGGYAPPGQPPNYTSQPAYGQNAYGGYPQPGAPPANGGMLAQNGYPAPPQYQGGGYGAPQPYGGGYQQPAPYAPPLGNQINVNPALNNLVPEFGKPLPQIPPSMAAPMAPGPSFGPSYTAAPAPPAVSPDEMRVSHLEQVAFGSTYPEHEVDDRLEHLEHEVFGKVSAQDSVGNRLARLEAKLGGSGAFGRSGGGMPSQPVATAPRGMPPLPPVQPNYQPNQPPVAQPNYQASQQPGGYQPNQPQPNQPPRNYPAQPYYGGMPGGQPGGMGGQPGGMGGQPGGMGGQPGGMGGQPGGMGGQPGGMSSGMPGGMGATPPRMGPGGMNPSMPRGMGAMPGGQPTSMGGGPRSGQPGAYQTGRTVPAPARTPQPPAGNNNEGVAPSSGSGQADSDDRSASEFATAVQSIPYNKAAGDYLPSIQHFAGGTYARWTSFPIRIHLPMNSPDAWKQALEGSMHKWDQAIPLMIAPSQEPADIEIAWINHLQPKQLGITNLEIFNGRMRVTVYLLRPTYYPPEIPEKVLQQVATHELGHALGIFGHSPNAGDAMHALESSAVRGKIGGSPNLTTRDINTLRKLYESPGLAPGFQSPQPISWSLMSKRRAPRQQFHTQK